MRHNNKLKKLNRSSSERKSLLSNLACSLVFFESIDTTTARAKSLSSYFDKLINTAKKGTIATDRKVFSLLGQNKLARDKVLEVLVKDLSERDGGYTRIYKVSNRKGDNAEMSKIEIIKNENGKNAKK